MQRLQSSRLMTKLWRKSRIAFASLFIALSLGNSARASHHTLASQGTQIVAMDKKKSIVKPSGIAQNLKAVEKTLVSNVKDVENKIVRDILEVGEDAKSSWENLVESLRGTKLDALILLIVTSAVIPIFKSLNTSPILGFLLTGVMLGPNGLSWVSDVHMMHVLGELGIVFFLFEMGLELSLDRLKKMKKDVFGLGTSQFVLTTALFSSIAKVAGLSTAAAVTIGGSLSLSSSAFVLQLLKDKGAMGTRYGKASFGILLLQDLAVVPLLVIVELLGKGGAGLGRALTFAGLKALVSLSTMSIVGRVVLNPLFGAVVKSKSQEAFLSIILSTVLIMSFVTKGIGLSDTLGAFLAGLLLAETKYHYQIEADIAPFRGLLLGFFFITVGFSIDPHLVLTEAPKIAVLLVSLILGKASIITGLSYLFGVSFSSAQQCGLLNSQAGEFSFVALGIAETSGLINPQLTKLLLTTVALSMAVTPMLGDLGSAIATRLEEKIDAASRIEADSEADELQFGSNDFLVVAGYGRVGQMVCDILDKKFVKYVAIDRSPTRSTDARVKGLPVFYGDITKPEVLKSFGVNDATAVVLALSDPLDTNKAVEAIKNFSPDVPIFARAKNADHKNLLVTLLLTILRMSILDTM
jgi:CPA2 family monovalent cation:H+ antiporter-2